MGPDTRQGRCHTRDDAKKLQSGYGIPQTGR